MKKVLFVLLILIPFYGWGQNPGKENFLLPSNLKKLSPLDKKVEFGWNINLYNIWERNYHFQTTFLSDDFTYYNSGNFRFDKPLLYQFHLSYRIQPGLKAGLLTHRRKTMYDDMSVSPLEEGIGGYIETNIAFKRTWGVFVEYSPFPVTFLRLRRWDVSLGGAITRENILVNNTITGSYSIDPGNWWDPNVWIHPSTEQIDSFQVPGALIYGKLNIYLSPWLSLNGKIGYYYIPTLKLSRLSVNLPAPRNDLESSPEPINLSWHYYSFGLSVLL